VYGNEKELAETARMGSVTYNISLRFWEEGIRELTPAERKEAITGLTSKYDQGALTPLETFELVRLLSIDERSEDEEKMVKSLASRIDSILLVDPKDHEALLTGVKLAMREGNNDLLIALLADTTLTDRTYRALLMELSNLHFGFTNYEKAEEVIDYVLTADSLDTEALMRKASIRATSLIVSLVTHGLVPLTEEIEQVEAKERLPLTAQRIEEEFREIDFSLVQKALEADPENFKFHCFIGGVKGFIVYLHYLVLLASIEDEDSLPRLTVETIPQLKDIEESLERALNLKPAGDIDVYMALAIHSLVMADYETARSYAQKAIETRPDLDQPYDALITVINFQRQAIEEDVETGFRESLEVLKKKEQHKPLQLIDRLMQVHPLLEEGKYEDMIAKLELIEKEYPDELQVLVFKGGALLRLGRVDESIEVLKHALMLDEKNQEILYNLGVAYVLKEAFGEAKVYLEAASENNPSDEGVEELLERVNSEFE
jgi:tetratricopeptide (TPR) repeat protein